MMDWSNNDMSGWGYALMSISMVLFWGLLIAGIVLLVRYLGNSGPHAPNLHQATPEAILAERFARGEIDDEEYRRRLDSLHGHDTPRTVVRP